ncbi:MAG: peptidoglycan bridge formation glycyltransferase FemA/FemB family protein, partial [Prevotellaceae bacterium]|nr:peptidoglycan bridge formation glycyltransferase FemA/FemB family protein [Prevotellaceae bacterium]
VYDKNWQKNLRRTEKYNLDFQQIIEPTEIDLKNYFEIHRQMSERKKFGDNLSLEMLQKLFCDPKFRLFFVENENKKRIAGLIIYERNGIATSLFSATSLEGREKSASYFLFDQTFKICAKNRILHYDCGRISPAAHKKNDVFLFKDGAKGEYVQYCGEFSFYKHQIYRELMYFVKKYFFKRVEV